MALDHGPCAQHSISEGVSDSRVCAKVIPLSSLAIPSCSLLTRLHGRHGLHCHHHQAHCQLSSQKQNKVRSLISTFRTRRWCCPQKKMVFLQARQKSHSRRTAWTSSAMAWCRIHMPICPSMTSKTSGRPSFFAAL